MIRREQDNLVWHEFELLADCPVIHGTFTRHGGCSSGFLASLNLGKSVGDLQENVRTNLEKVKKVLSISEVLSAKLCHGANIALVDSILQEKPISDGISTQRKGMGLMVTHADCQAAIFYDPVAHAIANVHCGWRGNVQNIYAETVSHLQQKYRSKPENLLVCISPSLGPANAQFINYRTELPESFWEYQIKDLYFDLWKISEIQLLKAGVLSHHIQIACIDTFANEKDYFSHRHSNNSGRNATICALQNPV